MAQVKEQIEGYETEITRLGKNTQGQGGQSGQENASRQTGYRIWAQTVGGTTRLPQRTQATTPTAGANGGTQTLVKPDDAKLRRITLKIRDEKEMETISAVEGEDLPNAFKNRRHDATKGIVAAFTKLKTNEVVLTIATREGREALEMLQEWTRATYSSATVLR